MRRVMHILLAVAVLWCGLHLGEPAHAHDEAEQHQAHDGASATDDGEQDRTGPAKAIHLHHHCPMATGQHLNAISAEAAMGEALLFVRPVAALHSRSQAPPLEPPVA